MRILGFQKTTLLDYPHKLASTIFLGGCNFRCPFCHNSLIVTQADCLPELPASDILSYLSKRKNILDGVCITGGEPTLSSELYHFIDQIKRLGYSIKLDTNGSNPDMVRRLIHHQLIDYVAMDIKNSPEHYSRTIGCSAPMDAIQQTIELLLEGRIPYEFRTTVVKELHNTQDFYSIGEWIHGASQYYLQNFQESDYLICPDTYHSWDFQKLHEFLEIVRPYVDSAALRGIDY